MTKEFTFGEIKFELNRHVTIQYGNRLSKILITFVNAHQDLFKKYHYKNLIKKFAENDDRQIYRYFGDAYTAILTHEDIFEAYLKDTASYDIYFQLAKDKYTSYHYIKKFITDEDDKSLFPMLYNDWRGKVYGLPPFIRQHLLHFFNNYPKPAQGLATIPATAYVFEGQAIIFNELPLLAAYVKQYSLGITQTAKRIKSSEINKLKNNLGSQEFFPKAKKLTGTLRHAFLGNLFINVPTAFYSKSSLDLLKYIFREVYIDESYKSAFTIFAYIKGLDKYYHNIKENWEEEVKKEIKMLTPNRWYEFDTWFLNLQLENKIDIFSFNIALDKIYESWFYQPGYSHSDKIDNNISFIHERFVDVPFLKGTLFTFAAFGLIDLAYDEAVDIKAFNGDIPDPYRSLKYFRLNDLGAYILGKTETYIPPQTFSNDELFLSKDALIITTHEDNKRAKMLLKEHMNKVGDNRYTTDYEKFTDKCYSIIDIKEKIKGFKNIVGKIPTNWQTFFDEIVKNAYPIEELDNYKIFKIKNNPELIRIIARDEVLKKWIIKAEQFHIVILEKDAYQVKKRLRQLGYFMA
jgi:hypothetical protein